MCKCTRRRREKTRSVQKPVGLLAGRLCDARNGRSWRSGDDVRNSLVGLFVCSFVQGRSVDAELEAVALVIQGYSRSGLVCMRSIAAAVFAVVVFGLLSVVVFVLFLVKRKTK